MKNRRAQVLPARLSRSPRAWSVLLLLLLLLPGATFGLAVECPDASVTSDPGQEPASQPVRREGTLWYPVAEDNLAAPDGAIRVESRKYRTVRLDRRQLSDLLARVPLEGTDDARKTDVVLELPLPDGRMATFRIEEASVVGPGLLPVRCPDLKTYRGRGRVGHAFAYVRFDWSPLGFHAMVSSDEEQVYISPYSRGDTQTYIVYYGRDWKPEPQRTEGTRIARQAAPGQSAAASAPPAQPSVPSNDEITIGRRCFMCEHPYRLTFRRDGTAALTIFGVGLYGTVDHTCRGKVASEDFVRLMAFIQGQGFFDLRETYRNEVQDGEWARISVAVDGRQKTVANANQAGPSNLTAIAVAIDALGKKIVWMEPRR